MYSYIKVWGERTAWNLWFVLFKDVEWVNYYLFWIESLLTEIKFWILTCKSSNSEV